jgi:hypothetical protein
MISGNGAYLNPEVISLSSGALSSPYQDSSASKSLHRGPQARSNHHIETQDVVDFGSQDLNLEVSSPPGSAGHDEEDAEESYPRVQTKSSRRLETQDIFDAETQYPDLNVPLPISDDDDLDDQSSNASQVPAVPKPHLSSRAGKTVESQALTDTPGDLEDKLDEWIATQMVRGHSDHACMQAMLCTSMRPDLAELVLLGEKARTGMPRDVPGIWSEYEDRVVEGGDAAALRRLEAKHGWDECEARMKFLAEWREV